MARERAHHGLLVWREAMNLVRDVYDMTSCFPQDEKFGLISQMRRAAVSVPANISEGAARNSAKEFMNFLYIARGSLSELETEYLIARDLGYPVEGKAVQARIDKTFTLLAGLIRKLKEKN
ncbi:four helix bundle protein [Thioalkalivibrio sulfidiphilus]|uniref:four helix bundle protein n=1 Tax=Thioalkalivibrio sulfidiphilus TaxID=1033854 RepID=UPI0003775636|nr:four helix bundle protein [Thioalkalivibrio sulfidiphilus]